MRAGRLDREITIQQRTDSRSGTGASNPTWSTFATTRAQVTHEGGRESAGAVLERATGEVTFRIRWRSGVNPTMRIVWESRHYDIVHIAEVGRRQGLDIRAVAQVES